MKWRRGGEIKEVREIREVKEIKEIKEIREILFTKFTKFTKFSELLKFSTHPTTKFSVRRVPSATLPTYTHN